MKNSQDDFEEERETNMASVLASLQTWGMEDVVRIRSYFGPYDSFTLTEPESEHAASCIPVLVSVHCECFCIQ